MYFSRKIEDRFTFLQNTGDSLQPLTREGIRIGLRLAHDKPKVVEYLIDNNMIDIVNCMNRSPSSFNHNQISIAANGQTASTNAQTIDSTKQWSKIIESNKFKKSS
jgi:hypothetical protein